MIRFAHTEWLLVSDIDEFVVVGTDHQGSLVSLVEHFQTIHCVGSDDSKMKNVACRPLNETNFGEIYALSISPFLMEADGSIRMEVVHQRKAIVRPSSTLRLDVHYPFPMEPRRSVPAATSLAPRQSWLAHFNENHRRRLRFDLDELLPQLAEKTDALRSER